jgi:DNA-binding response OmpR family regulator
MVLVIDDDPDIADAVADVLRTGGYDVLVAEDGNAGLACARHSKVDLVLLDWRLPTEPAGGSLVRRLRDTCGMVPIVVLSADPNSLNEARDAQVADYLPKPFEVEDLLHVVDTYCPA